MFIDDVDGDKLSILAWGFVDKRGWAGHIEAPYQVRDALYKGFCAGYEQARKDEKEMYAEAKQLIEETHRKQRYKDMAEHYKNQKEKEVK